MARFTNLVTQQDLAGAFPQPVSWTPVLSATGFFQTSNPSTGTYLKYGRMVVVNLLIPFSEVTDFGTGQYSVTLPFSSNFHQDVVAGSLHNTNANAHYTVKGHLGESSNVMTIWYISGASRDEPFTHNSPISLDETDLFHMSFIYETDE
jgi:hypothetical protein